MRACSSSSAVDNLLEDNADADFLLYQLSDEVMNPFFADEISLTSESSSQVRMTEETINGLIANRIPTSTQKRSHGE